MSRGSLGYKYTTQEGHRHTSAQVAKATVSTQYTGFRRFWQYTHQLIDQTNMYLPPIELNTIATWVKVPPDVIQQVQAEVCRWQIKPTAKSRHLHGCYMIETFAYLWRLARCSFIISLFPLLLSYAVACVSCFGLACNREATGRQVCMLRTMR